MKSNVVISVENLQENSPQTGTIDMIIDVDGIKRAYILYVPETYVENKMMPLVFNYHGYGSNAKKFMSIVDFRLIADEEGFILVYPQGTIFNDYTHWNIGGWTIGSTADDVGFTEIMIDDISARYAIDLKRIYAVGHSNGGYFSYVLACQLSNKIAAIASMAGPMTYETFADCAPERPIPILHFHGDTDPSVRYEGDFYTHSVQEVLDFWIEHNQCETSAIKEIIAPKPITSSQTSIEYYLYDSCAQGINVRHYKVLGGGHEWLGTPNQFGEVNKDLDTNQAIWNFFNLYDLDGVRE